MKFKTEDQIIERYDPESPAMKCLYDLKNYLQSQETRKKKKTKKQK